MKRGSGPGEALDRRLRPLVDLRGVRMVAVVDADGLVMHQYSTGPDAELVCGHVPVVMASMRRLVADSGLSPASVLVSESGNGMILASPLSMDFALVVVADANAVLGSIRYVLRETLPDLNSLLARGYR